MTVQEMHTYFKFLIDDVGSLEFVGFEPEEIDLALNQYLRTFIKQRYGGLNIHRTGFEETQKRTDDLRELTTNAVLLPNVAQEGKPNSVWYPLPDDYWFSIQEDMNYNRENCPSGIMEIVARRHDSYNRWIKNPYLKPNLRRSCRMMIGNNIEVIYDTRIIPQELNLRYVRKPQEISLSLSQDCELAEETHEEIVRGAVSLAISTVLQQNRVTQDFTITQE